MRHGHGTVVALTCCLIVAANALVGCSSAGNHTTAVPPDRAPATTIGTTDTPGIPASPTAAARPTLGVPPATATVAARPSPTPRPDETATATAMLLALSDFPAGWVERPSSPTDAPALTACNPTTPLGSTGRAASGDFTRGGSSSISEVVALFPTPAAAAAALSDVPTALDCMVHAINSGGLDTPEATVSQASAAPAAFPRTGDVTRAYRITFHVQLKGQSGPTAAADAYVDLVYVLSGRAGLSLLAYSADHPYDPAQLQAVTQAALGKVQKRLPVQ